MLLRFFERNQCGGMKIDVRWQKCHQTVGPSDESLKESLTDRSARGKVNKPWPTTETVPYEATSRSTFHTVNKKKAVV